MIPPSGILVEFFAALDEHVHQGSGIGSAGCIAQTHLLALQQQHARGQFTTFLWLQFSPACNFASEARALAQSFQCTLEVSRFGLRSGKAQNELEPVPRIVIQLWKNAERSVKVLSLDQSASCM